MLGRLLHYTLYIHFHGLLPSNGILPALKFPLIQVLHSPLLAALLHGTRAAAISQTLAQGMELRNFRRGATYIRLDGHHLGHRPIF